MLATRASAITKMAATSGGRARRRNQERNIIAAASRQAASSATKPTRSRWLISSRLGSGTRRSPQVNWTSSGRDRLRAETGLGAHVDLVKLLLGQAVGLDELAEVGAEERQRESDGNADDADVLQRERGMRVDRHGPARADGDEPDGDERAAYQRRDRPPRVEPLPEKREQDGGQVGRGGDDKRDAGDQGGRIGGGADACRKPDGQQADEACRDARHEHLLAIADVSVEDVGPDHIDVKVVAESSRCGERESGHDGEDGGKGDRGDERQQELTARTAEELSAEILSQT